MNLQRGHLVSQKPLKAWESSHRCLSEINKHQSRTTTWPTVLEVLSWTACKVILVPWKDTTNSHLGPREFPVGWQTTCNTSFESPYDDVEHVMQACLLPAPIFMLRPE